jgi:hypothetical protein
MSGSGGGDGMKKAASLGGLCKVESKSQMLTRFAAALDQPIDTVANCKNRKASASNGSRGPLRMVAISVFFVAGLCRRRS